MAFPNMEIARWGSVAISIPAGAYAGFLGLGIITGGTTSSIAAIQALPFVRWTPPAAPPAATGTTAPPAGFPVLNLQSGRWYAGAASVDTKEGFYCAVGFGQNGTILFSIASCVLELRVPLFFWLKFLDSGAGFSNLLEWWACDDPNPEITAMNSSSVPRWKLTASGVRYFKIACFATVCVVIRSV